MIILLYCIGGCVTHIHMMFQSSFHQQLTKSFNSAIIFFPTFCVFQDSTDEDANQTKSEMRGGVYYFVQLSEKLLFQHITTHTQKHLISEAWASLKVSLCYPLSLVILFTFPSHIFTCPISSCDVCLRSKQSFFVFSISLNKCTTPLELIYYDILGDYSKTSRSRSTQLFLKENFVIYCYQRSNSVYLICFTYETIP